MAASGLAPPLLLALVLFCVLPTRSSSQAAPFKCSSTATCTALVDYISPNRTTLAHIQTLFTVRSFRSLLGANNLPPSTSPNTTVEAQRPTKVPFPCVCRNGTGVSNGKPLYKVVKDDGLYHIAVEVFSGLVTYQQIAAANNITNVNLILVGQELWIPLPCSCDDVDGAKVVHYGHVVQSGGTLEAIAQDYGTTVPALTRLNNGVNDSSLLAGQVLDVPVKANNSFLVLAACNSSVRSDSQDYPLLVANNTYIFTAMGCVKCKCDPSNNWTLQCEPSGAKPTNWSTCPAMQYCQGADGSLLSLGNTTATSCGAATCAYAGFNRNQTIFTTLATPTCPANTPGN
ncbi:hypothetical protein Tsubulata_020750 [Turnera subulata]|uniref:LysM domain-containing protein n=1 Tax=Turnera subulata TaxID=218843 RepID=A0A9Q0J611_9ROSI|nr:hypothetical protein Tsubulata_020750 [Turnera subulata]